MRIVWFASHATAKSNRPPCQHSSGSHAVVITVPYSRRRRESRHERARLVTRWTTN